MAIRLHLTEVHFRFYSIKLKMETKAFDTE